MSPSLMLSLAPAVSPPSTTSTLSQYAKPKNINVGAFFSECLWDPPDGAACKQIVTSEYASQIMPFEYDWVSVEPTQGNYDFRGFDVVASFTQQTHTKMHVFHLIWNPPLQIHPTWLFPSPNNCGSWTREQLLPIMKSYIQTYIRHGNDTVSAWNVVNEAFADNGLHTSSCFYKIIGPDYIDQAFHFAKEANPKGVLILSDFFGAGGFGAISRTKVDNFLEFTRAARDRGVPIEAVGIQNHLLSRDGYQFTSQYLQDLEYFLQKAKAISVPVYITEMDVYHNGESQDRVAEVYRQTMSLCLQFDNCRSLATFGISDKYSAANGALGINNANPLLFDSAYMRKPAYYGIMDAIRQDTWRSCTLPGDFNHDNHVSLADYNLLVLGYGTTYTLADYNTLISNYGRSQ